MRFLKKATAVVMVIIMMMSLVTVNGFAATIKSIEILEMPVKTTFEYGKDWQYGYWKFPEDDGLGVFTPKDDIITFMHRGGLFSFYQDRGMLDMTGLKVKVTYSDGSTKTVAYKETLNSNNVVSQNILASPASGEYKIGENTIEIYFAENTRVYTTFKINIVIMGDLNNDKKVNSTDALLVLQSSVKTVSLTAAQKAVADMNADGKINSFDALQILKIAVS